MKFKPNYYFFKFYSICFVFLLCILCLNNCLTLIFSIAASLWRPCFICEFQHFFSHIYYNLSICLLDCRVFVWEDLFEFGVGLFVALKFIVFGKNFFIFNFLLHFLTYVSLIQNLMQKLILEGKNCSVLNR